jgi:hypothetical protein
MEQTEGIDIPLFHLASLLERCLKSRNDLSEVALYEKLPKKSSMEHQGSHHRTSTKIKNDNCEIRTHACEHNALAGRRLNHSAKLSLNFTHDFIAYVSK